MVAKCIQNFIDRTPIGLTIGSLSFNKLGLLLKNKICKTKDWALVQNAALVIDIKVLN